MNSHVITACTIARWLEITPFGVSGRARRVQDRRVVVGRDVDPGQRMLAEQERAHRRATLGQTRSVARDDRAARAGSARSSCTRSKRSPSADQQLRAAVGDAVTQLGAGPPAVERNEHRADRGRRHVRDRATPVVAHRQRDPVALAHAEVVHEPVREVRGALLDVGERVALVLVDPASRAHRGRPTARTRGEVARRMFEDGVLDAIDRRRSRQRVRQEHGEGQHVNATSCVRSWGGGRG